MSNTLYVSSPSSPSLSLSLSPSPSPSPNPIINHVSIQYHDKEIPLPVELFSNDAELQFGIFNLFIRDQIPILKNHIHIFFTIDSTGSMSDVCADGRVKMQHILYTLENMLRVFHEKTACDISVHVQSFDTSIYEIVTDVPHIASVEIENIIQKIRKIRPGGSTNIELALQSASKKIADYKTLNPDHNIAHLFLTDGEITDGSHDFQLLKTLVPTDCENIFIGYGTQHDSHLLSFLGSGSNNEYRFVDALEKAGLVYGEIIHSLFYKAITDVILQTDGCEIYDYSTNSWTTALKIGNLVSEQKKIYHLRSKIPETSQIQVFGLDLLEPNTTNTLQIECHYTEQANLVNYALRQKTQELLYDARKLSEKSRYNNPSYNIIGQLWGRHNVVDTNGDAEETKTIKKTLKQFHSLLLDFIKDNHLEHDPFIKTLCDDIYIAHKTVGTPYAAMFTTARQTSQGRQHAYNCSTVDDIETDYNKQFTLNNNIFRSFNPINNPNINTYDDDINNYTVSMNALSPYTSDGVVTLMRDVSGDTTLSIINPVNEEVIEGEVPVVLSLSLPTK